MRFGATDIYQFDVEVFSSVEAQGVCTPEEEDSAERFHFDRDRQAYLCTRVNLRRLLSERTGIPAQEIQFVKSEFGKPSIDPKQFSQPIHFNLSHAKQCVLIAINTKQEVGIDVEYIQREIDYLPLAERFFAKQEYQQLKALPAEQQKAGFFKAWVCKEALLKAQGKGLSAGLDQIIMDLDPESKAAWLNGTAQLTLFSPMPDYLAALAVPRLRCRA